MRRCSPLSLFAATLLAALCWPAVVVAQTPLYLVNDRTQVRTIDFSFSGTQTFEPDLLEEQIALTDMGALVGFRRRFSFIPFVPPVGTHLFSPIEMQKDVVRLERFYHRNGFLHPEVDWLVRLDSTKNTVRLVYTIEEGPPLLLEGLVFVGPDDQPAIDVFPPSLRDDWRAFRDETALQQGSRLDDFTLLQLESQTLGWVRDQGYAFADVIAASQVDSLRSRADVVIGITPGPRGRISEIQVEGAESVSSTVVRRELPFRVGDRFSASELVEGQREVFSLNLFQIALADVPDDQPEDSTVVVRLRVREGDPRIITGQGGYLSEAGLTGQAQWTHRNFFGGARTFTASTLANTGFGSFVTDPSVLYRASVTLRQPYFLNRRLALLASPFAELRDDEFEESTSFGGNVTLLYELAHLKTASLQYGFEARDVTAFRFGATDDTQTSFIDSLQNVAVELGRIDRNTLGLTATYGNLDDDLNPRRGYILRPSLEIAGPPQLSSVEYGRGNLTATAFYPLTRRTTLFARLTGGYLIPYGRSVPPPGVGFSALLRLRNSVFLGGGTADVRGWGNGLLGPKALDLIRDDTDAGTDTLIANRYFPLGGLTKLAGTVEARLPFPGFGPTWGTFVFFDAGRVWIADDRFALTESAVAFILDDSYGDAERFFFSTGAGFSFATPVGALRFAIGYKLNPSFFDLRSPADIAKAIFDAGGTDVPADVLEAAIRDVAPNNDGPFGIKIPQINRIHLHLTIGQTF